MAAEQRPGEFSPWQAFALGQFSNAVIAVFALTVAALGSEIMLLLNQEFDAADRWQIIAFALSVLSLLLFFFSAAFGIWLVINRLRDFRANMNAARLSDESGDASRISRYWALADRLRRRSWRLFWFQIGLFGGGILFAVTGVLILLLRFVALGGMPDSGTDI